MAVSKLLQHFNIYYSAARMNEELLQNIRIHSSDIFCQLHHLFLPVLSLKGIYHPWCLSALCLHKLFSNRLLKYTLQLCLGFILTRLAITHVTSRAIMFYWCVSQTWLLSRVQLEAKRIKKKNLTEWHDGNGMKYIYFIIYGLFSAFVVGGNIQMHKS